jgi:hypothetical protein
MTDEVNMRQRLQHVAAYRELCRSVRKSGRENSFFALLMAGIAYFLHSNGMAGQQLLLFYGILIGGELLVGLFKWAVPSAEGVLLDGLVLLSFAGFNAWLQYERFQNGFGLSPILVFFSLYLLLGAFNRFKNYGDLRRLFAERPAPEHVAWFDDLVREIQLADPLTDELVLDLPTRPHWKAKLLGGTAFFVAAHGNAVWVVGSDEFLLRREKTDRNTGSRRAMLSIQGEGYPEFELGDVSWANYQKWKASQATPQPLA